MDNLSPDKRTATRQVIKAAGASVWFLPPYSPDQGDRTLTAPGLRAGSGGPSLNAAVCVFEAVLSLEQAQGQPPEAGQVLGGVALADPAVVFAEDHVQRPVQLVLHAPVPAGGGEQSFGIAPIA